MRLTKRDDQTVPGTEFDNIPLALETAEFMDHPGFRHDESPPQHPIKEAEAEAHVDGDGEFDPDPDGDDIEEAIIRFHHRSTDRLSFRPDAEIDVGPSIGGVIKVQFPMPATQNDPPFVWDGEIDVERNGQHLKTLRLKVKVTKAGPAGFVAP